MTEHRRKTVCPHCKAKHDRMSNVAGSDTMRPKDGDLSMCVCCGCWLVFDSKASGQLRLPDRDEQARLDQDPRIAFFTAAWASSHGIA